MKTWFPTAAFLLSFSSVAASQLGVALPDTFTGDASAVVIGRLDGDTVPDAAVLQGGNVYVVSDPDRHNFFLTVAGPFYSICKVGTSTPGQDALLATTNSGVARIQWDSPTHAMLVSSVLTNSDWASGKQLQSLKRDATSPEMICGLSASGTKLLHAQWVGMQLDTTPWNPILVAKPQKTLAGLYWDGDTSLDLACDDGRGLSVFSSAGAQLSSYPSTYAAPLLLRLPPDAGCTNCADYLIWLSYASGGQVITVVHAGAANQVIFDQALACVPGVVVARLTLADYDKDGRLDIVTTRSDQPLARVLYRQIGSMTFGVFGGSGGQNGVELNVSSVSGGCASAPPVAAGDLDGDGDYDLVYAGHASCTAQVHVYFANGAVESEWKAWTENGGFVSYPPTGGPAQWVIEPAAMPGAVVAAGGMNLHVQVWAWQGPTHALGEQIADFTYLMPSDPPQIPVDIAVPTTGIPNFIFAEVSYTSDLGLPVVRSFPAWQGYTAASIGIDALTGSQGGLLPGPLPPPPGPNP